MCYPNKVKFYKRPEALSQAKTDINHPTQARFGSKIKNLIKIIAVCPLSR
jgi:hypothetical protein